MWGHDVFIQDKNDAPVFAVSNTTVLIEENWGVGRPFFVVRTVDEDRPLHGDSSAFRLVGGNTTLFDVDIFTGELVAGMSFNFEDRTRGPMQVGAALTSQSSTM